METFIRIEPAFPPSHHAIAFAANEEYCPYLSVMLRSVIDVAKKDKFYDIIILHRDISSSVQQRMEDMAAGCENFSVRFCDVSSLVAGFDFYTGGKEGFSIDAYLRFLIPFVLSENYDKALYLDGDMIARVDISPLLETDLEGYLLASTRDMGGIADYYYPSGSIKAYRDKVLHISNPDNYFISGMLVMNLFLFREEFTLEGLLKMAASRNWRQHDQDVLNVLCDKKTKILHASWDVLKPYKPDYLPPMLRQELEESVAMPKIIHFGGDEKPWKNTLSPWMDIFWETAVRTPFYKEIIYRILEEHPGTINEVMELRFKKGYVGFKYILRFARGWFTYKWKLLVKRRDLRNE